MTPLIKICGLSTPAALDAALAAGADMVGFVFFPKSPRNVGLAAARALGAQARGRARIVALTVDADDALLAGVIEALDPDILQLHGRGEPGPGRRHRRPLRPADDEGGRRRSARRPRGRGGLRGRGRPSPDRRQAAQGRGPAGRQRPAVRLAARPRFRATAAVAAVGRLDARQRRRGDPLDRRPRRRRVVRRRARAGRQGRNRRSRPSSRPPALASARPLEGHEWPSSTSPTPSARGRTSAAGSASTAAGSSPRR